MEDAVDRFRSDGGRSPFVLDVPQVVQVAHRAASCRDVIATFALASSLMPFDPSALAASRIAGFDVARATIEMPDPRGIGCRVGLGRAACAVLVLAAAGRAKGFLFADVRGDPIRADRDAEDRANEALSAEGAEPLPFRFSFRSLREGVFAAVADGGVRQDLALSLAGLGRPARRPGEGASLQAEQRDALDWWARELGLVVQRGRRLAIHGSRRTHGGRGGDAS